jgi:alcohol dehydrogenase
VVYVASRQQELPSAAGQIIAPPELTILASRNALSQDFSRIIQLIEDGHIDTQPWITHQSTFETMIDDFPSG